MQIVYISNRPRTAVETLEHVEAWMPFLHQAVVVCPAGLAEEFRFRGRRLEVLVLDESAVLGARRERFEASRDHQVRNWCLRAALAEADEVDGEFIMSDDDSRPLTRLGLELFKEDGKYHGYYYYDLAKWRPSASDYDAGQHATCELLAGEGLGTLSYSSHMPQLIDKGILAEAVDWLEQKGASRRRAIDEWSLYFNYARHRYPRRFHPPRPFRTLCWPALPTDWEYDVRPPAYAFENYYPHHYAEGGIFAGIPSGFDPTAQPARTREKLDRRLELQRIYESWGAVSRRKAAWCAHRLLRRCHARWPGSAKSLVRLVPASFRRLAREVFLHGDDPAWSFPRRRKRV